MELLPKSRVRYFFPFLTVCADVVARSLLVNATYHRLQSSREAMAYQRLKVLQGQTLPLSYGFFYVRSPKVTYQNCDTSVDCLSQFDLPGNIGPRPKIGHVMEFIDQAEDPQTSLLKFTEGENPDKASAYILVSQPYLLSHQRYHAPAEESDQHKNEACDRRGSDQQSAFAPSCTL